MIPPETEAPPGRQPFWDYADLGLFITLSIVSLFLALLLLRFIPFLHALKDSYKLLVGQLIWYLLAFGWLYLILRARYNRPFWSSLGWLPPRIGDALGSFAFGPLLAIGLGLIGAAMRTPQVHLPFEGMLNSPAMILLFGVLIVAIGPICEELAFRGLMMPLFIRSLGAAAGILITGLLFGLLHGFEYPDWRPVVLIGVAGAVFGWRRYHTGSTVNSTLMHAGFNATQFAALLAAEHANLR